MLANLIDGFMLRRQSWLAWSQLNDLDTIREADRSGALERSGSPKPETFEFGLAEELLAGLLAFAQAEASPGDRVRPLSARTAFDVLREEKAHEAFTHINDVVQRVSAEEYAAFCAEVGPQL